MRFEIVWVKTVLKHWLKALSFFQHNIQNPLHIGLDISYGICTYIKTLTKLF